MGGFSIDSSCCGVKKVVIGGVERLCCFASSVSVLEISESSMESEVESVSGGGMLFALSGSLVCSCGRSASASSTMIVLRFFRELCVLR